jgi:hypothetical protein
LNIFASHLSGIISLYPQPIKLSKNKTTVLFILTSSLFISLGCLRNIDPYSSKFAEGEKKGVINSILLSEASGIVSSRANPGYLWVINDSGNQPNLLLIDSTGQLKRTYWIENAINLDWEDIAIHTDQQTGQNTIYIADIGDNFAIRPYISIITLKEPSSGETIDSSIAPLSTHYFQYEDGPRDAETLLVDPLTSALYIISKREENVRIYKAPEKLAANDTFQLSFQAALPFHNITAGDISMDGSEILLKTYNAIFYWKKAKGEPVVETLSKPHELLRYQPEPQGESISWEENGKGYYTLSEKNALKDQVLYYYKRK